MGNKVQIESGLSTGRTDPDMNPVRLIAVVEGGRAFYAPWKLHQLPEGFLFSTPKTDQQAVYHEAAPAADSSEETSLQDTADLPEDSSHASEQEIGSDISFVQVPHEDGSSCLSDVQSVVLPHSERNETHAISVPEMPDGYAIRQFLKHGAHYYALAEAFQAGGQCHSQLYRQHQSDPDRWQMLGLPLQKLHAGQRFSHLASFNNRLYTAMDDEVSGFRLWCTESEEPLEAGWTEVISKGAYRFTANAHISVIFVEKDRMLIACAASRPLAGIKGRPVGAELIAVQGDSWDVIVGSTRVSPEGLIVPLAAMGRGFDDPAASRMSSVSRSGVEYLVALHSCSDSGSPVVNTLWSSVDLLDWKAVELPPVFADQHMTLLGAYRQSGAILYLVQRPADSNSQESADLMQSALPRDVELWIEEQAHL